MLNTRLKNRREELNLSQKYIADKLGITRQGYGHYETGRNEPDSKTLIKLTEILDCTADYLYGNTDTPKTSEEDFDSLAALKEIVQDLGIEDLFFHNINDIKNLSPEAVDDIRNHLEYTIYKERQRRDKDNKK